MPAMFWILLLMFCVGLCGWAFARGTNAEPRATAAVTARQVKGLNRAQIKTMLQRIAAAPAPAPIMGAMCYKPAMPPKVSEYICPTCGEKTIYTEGQARFIQWELTACRNIAKEILKTSGETVALDESACCRKCRSASKTPALTLAIRFDDGVVKKTEQVRSDQLRLLRDFLAGQMTVTGAFDDKTPLKVKLPELEMLLGEVPAK